jgi:UDP-glucose 4-epimerase
MAVGRVKDSTLKVFGNDYPTHDGTCVRDYLHVMDLAGGHRLALEALDETTDRYERVFKSALEAGDGRYKAYNLGRGRGQSVFDIVEAMRKATGRDFKTEVTSRRYILFSLLHTPSKTKLTHHLSLYRPGDVPDLTADPTLAEQELGFKAPQDLETMCRDLWNWQTMNPNGYADLGLASLKKPGL